jgi:hypothetical protein
VARCTTTYRKLNLTADDLEGFDSAALTALFVTLFTGGFCGTRAPSPLGRHAVALAPAGRIAFALAIGGWTCKRMALALTAAGLLSYFLTFAYATLACGLIAAALWWLRRGSPRALTPRA